MSNRIITTGRTNSTPGSIVQQKSPATVCRRIIFKRIHESTAKVIEDEAASRHNVTLPGASGKTMTLPSPPVPVPLTDAEKQNPPAKYNPAYIVWEERLKRTPLSNDERNNEPAYGTPERTIWRMRSQLGTDEDTYGHWWVEIYKKGTHNFSKSTIEASYGWWPVGQVDLSDTLSGVSGILNWGRSKTFDPHATDKKIDWAVDEAFHPAVAGKNEQKLVDCIKKFALAYDSRGNKWAFPAAGSTYLAEKLGRSNCHIFQEELIEHCKKEAGMLEKKIPIDRSRVIK